jgi:hypothetical protein
MALAEHDPRQRLDLELGERVPLRPCECADVGLGSLDVVANLGRHLRDDPVDLLGSKLEAVRRPVIEPLRELPDRHVAASADIGDDRCDRLTDDRRRWGHAFSLGRAL